MVNDANVHILKQNSMDLSTALGSGYEAIFQQLDSSVSGGAKTKRAKKAKSTKRKGSSRLHGGARRKASKKSRKSRKSRSRKTRSRMY